MEIPLLTTTEGTTPPGSEWARIPVPACLFCDIAKCGSAPINVSEPIGSMIWGGRNTTYYGGKAWAHDAHCGVNCAGETDASFFSSEPIPGTSRFRYVGTTGQLCEGRTQFPEPLPGLSGFTYNSTTSPFSIDAYSILDLVLVPEQLAPGPYLLSLRWDCEQSPQVWQNCADILVQ